MLWAIRVKRECWFTRRIKLWSLVIIRMVCRMGMQSIYWNRLVDTLSRPNTERFGWLGKRLHWEEVCTTRSNLEGLHLLRYLLDVRISMHLPLSIPIYALRTEDIYNWDQNSWYGTVSWVSFFLYGIRLYTGKSFGLLPPVIFSIASRIYGPITGTFSTNPAIVRKKSPNNTAIPYPSTKKPINAQRNNMSIIPAANAAVPFIFSLLAKNRRVFCGPMIRGRPMRKRICDDQSCVGRSRKVGHAYIAHCQPV